MKNTALPIKRCLREMSPSELKVYLYILEHVQHHQAKRFDLNLMGISRGCDISIPTAKSALDRLVRKGNVVFNGRPYRTAPGEYSLPESDAAMSATIVPTAPDLIPKSSESESSKIKVPYIKDIIHNNALGLIEAAHLSDAKARFQRILNQEDLKDYYVEYVWKNIDEKFKAPEVLSFLHRVGSGESLKTIVHDFIELAETQETETENEVYDEG